MSRSDPVGGEPRPGGPFHVVREGVWVAPDTVESPWVWQDGAGHLHMLAEGVWPTAAGRHAFSTDGAAWTLSPGEAYNTTVEGTGRTFARRGRPQLAVDAEFGGYYEGTPALVTTLGDDDGFSAVHVQGVLGRGGDGY